MKSIGSVAVPAFLICTLFGCHGQESIPGSSSTTKAELRTKEITGDSGNSDRELKSLSFDQWIHKVAALSAQQQVDAVTRKLQELNQGFNGEVESTIEKGVVTEFKVSGQSVADISPIRALTGLASLVCGSTQVSDLSPLQGSKITRLTCDWTKVTDLSPLKGLKLTMLDCGVTNVSDLSPLAEMKLAEFDCELTRVSDLSPLRAMNLTTLNCCQTRVADLSALAGMNLRSLDCWQTAVSDLSPLKGMRLDKLNIGRTAVSDLSPLTGMKLTVLGCFDTKVADLAPLQGMPLKKLYFYRTEVADLSPLKGMKPEVLNCEKTRVTDYTPLRDAGVSHLICDFNPERDGQVLRSIQSLQEINGTTTDKFWKQLEIEKDGK